MAAETYVRICRTQPFSSSEAVLVATRLVDELEASGRVTVEEMHSEMILLRVEALDPGRIMRDQVARLLSETRFEGWELAEFRAL